MLTTLDSLLLQHNKHYHNIDANMDGTSACSSVQSESSEAKPSESAGESVASQPALAAASTATDTATNVNGEKGKKVKSDKRRLTLETRPEGSPSQNKKVKLESASCASVESTPIYSYASTSAFYTNFAETKTFGKKAKPNLVLPFFDARQLADEHENDNIDETVKCICPVKEENGLMVQCEVIATLAPLAHTKLSFSSCASPGSTDCAWDSMSSQMFPMTDM